MTLYHCSPEPGLKTLRPSGSRFGKPRQVCLTASLPMALMYGVRHFEYTYGYNRAGELYYEEFFPNALAEIYRGKKASLYVCAHREDMGTTVVPNEYVTPLEVPVEGEILIPDVYTALREQERQGTLKIVRWEDAGVQRRARMVETGAAGHQGAEAVGSAGRPVCPLYAGKISGELGAGRPGWSGKRRTSMNTANKLTMLRVVLIPVYLILWHIDAAWSIYAALAVFVAASLTDLLDGYIARHYNQVTDFGKFMDPLADKVLVLTAMACFCSVGRFPDWALVIVIAREFAVSGLRLVAVDNGRVIAAGWSGKVKTASTMVCLCLMHLTVLPIPMEILDWVCVLVIAATTLYSGIEYFVLNRDVLNWNK